MRTETTRLILAALRAYQARSPGHTPTVAELASIADVAPSTAWRHLHQLDRRGEIEIASDRGCRLVVVIIEEDS